MPYEGFWTAVRLGGTTGALDKIDGDDLSDKDMAILMEATDTARFWWLDDDASGSEGETIVNPDTNAGTKSWLLLGITLPNTGLHILDTDASHDLIIKPNEDIGADRTFNLIVNDADRTFDLAENLKILDGQDIELHASGGEKAQLAIDTQNAERTLDLSENLTLADGYNFTLQALGQANSLILNESLTVGDGNSGTITFSQASKTLRVEDNSYINQDLTTDASPSFTKVISTELEYAGNITIDAANTGGNSLVYITNSSGYTASLSVENHIILGGNINALNLTAQTVGWTIAGGTTSKTLTLDDNFVASTQLAAIGANTNKVTESTSVTAPLVLTTYDISMPAATSGANGYMTSTYAGKLDGIDTGATDDQSEAEILTLLGLTSVEVDQLGNIAATTISEAQWGYLGGATANGGALIDAANYAAMMALLSGEATGAFSFNSQNLSGLGTLATAAGTLTIDETASLSDYAKESVLGTSIGDGLLLDGTVLEASVVLQKYHAINPAADVQSLLGCADEAAIRTLLDLEAGTDFYSMSAADAEFAGDGANSDITSMSGITGAIATPTNLANKTTAGWSKSIGSGGDYADWATMIAAMPDLIAHAVTVTIKAGTTLSETCTIKNKHGLKSAAVILIRAEKYFPTSGQIPTADSATATTLRDAALATAALGDDYFNDCWVFICDGTGTDNGFVPITDYVDATGDVVVSSWPGTQPDGTSRYIIVGALIDGESSRLNNLDIFNNTAQINLIGIGTKGSTSYSCRIHRSLYFSGTYCTNYGNIGAAFQIQSCIYSQFIYCGLVNGQRGIRAENSLYTKTNACAFSDNSIFGIDLILGGQFREENCFGDNNGTWGLYATLSGQAYISGTECSGSSGNHSDAGTADTAADDQAAAYTA